MARRSGQVTKRGERKWAVSVFVHRDPRTGKRIYQSKTIHGTKRDADAALREMLRRRDSGQLVLDSAETVAEYLSRWLSEAKAGTLSVTTLTGYRKVIDRYVVPHIGTRRLIALSPLDVQGLYTHLRTTVGLGNKLVEVHAILRNALAQAVRWRLIDTNPADAVDKPRRVKREMRALSEVEAQAFLRAAEGDRFELLFRLALHTGCRPGELLGLQWGDFALAGAAPSMKIQRAVKRDGDLRILGPTKTPKSRRTIPLPHSLAKALRAARVARQAASLEAGAPMGDTDLVFASEAGGIVAEANLTQRHFKPILAKAGLPKTIRLYDLRHTCATLLLAAGENPKVVAERLGHTGITLLLDTYVHVMPGMQKAATDRLEALLGG